MNNGIHNLFAINVNSLSMGSIKVDSTLVFKNITNDEKEFRELVYNAIVYSSNDSNIIFDSDSVEISLGNSFIFSFQIVKRIINNLN